VSAESIGETAFLVVAWPRGAKLSSAGTAPATVGQNRAKTSRREATWSKRRVKSESQNGKFRVRL